ncbi:protein translocase subunit SecDF [Oceanobacillus sp. CAU 1775]
MKKRGKLVAFFLIVIALGIVIGTSTSGVTKNINLGLDLQGGFEVLYEVTPVDTDEDISQSLMEGTVRTLNDRVNRLGISEAVIDIEGEDRIRVQLAGVENQQQARDMLATSAQLSFRDVNDVEYMDGSDIRAGSAKQDFHSETNLPIVTLQLNDSNKFGEVTTEISQMRPDNLLVIWMDFEEGDSFAEEVMKEDPKFISSPSVDAPLHTSSVMISGSFTVEEAQMLADVINSGSLPVHMTEIFSTSVGAQFGEQALNDTVFAGIIGLALVILFLIIAYRFTGIIASINLVVYTFIVLLVFYLMNGILTLSGIAALILGVGMAVDANVISFERYKEEIRSGKSIKAAFESGNKNSFRTILDANLTTMIAAVVLFIFGTSSVKGFATMLIISILVSFLTAVFGTRLLTGFWVKSGYLKGKHSWFGVKTNQIKDLDAEEEEPQLFKRNVDIVKHRKKFFIFTTLLIILGSITILIFKINPGIDFTSGTRVEIITEETLSIEEIESTFESLNLEAKSIVLSGDNSNIAVARFETVLIDQDVAEVQDTINDSYGVEPGVSVVSPIVGQELVKNAIYAVAIAAFFIIIYIAFRFEIIFGITAVIALLHDVFIMLFVFSITQIEFDITIVSAILTIIGYSLNNTIVIFDRIRENIQKDKRVTNFSHLAKIINRSIIQSFTRTMNTSISTLIAIFAFLILGTSSIFTFTLALVIGLLAGTYSSLFLASQIWLVWRGRNLKDKPLDFRKKKKLDGPVV